MITRTSWAHYDQPRLLSGGELSGAGIEIDRHIDGLLADAGRRRLVNPSRVGIRRQVGMRLVRIGAAIQGADVPPCVEQVRQAG
jgi:hypothetical protein